MGNSNGKPVVLTDEVNLNHFRLLRVVGKGAFGKVRIVERRDTGLTFALKYIRKDEIVRSESVRNIIRERRMLEHLNHPFLCNLRYSFQDIEYLYIVQDLMTGGDLRFHITRKTFTEQAVRFWIAELGCALRYVHQQGIVHRDVKPDNILLDSEGHVHLADFNVASELTAHRQLTSKSGTLAYLAPEIYSGKGYASEVDWWSLGVTFYECIYNKRPFDGHHHAEQLAQQIVKGDPPFPTTSPPVSNPCLHAISSLLEKNKNLRIGAAGFSTFTDNPFFREIDFEALERKEIEPIFCPSSEKTNFDATYDLEELLLEEAPLEARARKQKPRAELREDATREEIRANELHKMIETMFEPFNYTLLPPDRAPAPAVATPASPRLTPGLAPAQSETSSPTDPNAPRLRTKEQRSVPSRSQTPRSMSRTRSSAHSPEGSPPLFASGVPQEYFGPTSNSAAPPVLASKPAPQGQRTRTLRYEDEKSSSADATSTNPSSSSPKSHRIRGSARSTSFSGPGVSGGVGLFGGHASPSDMMASAVSENAVVYPRSSGTSSDNSKQSGQQQQRADKPTGMLGFLSRKKGRDRSPKGKEKEPGVLGKEGLRVVVGHG